MFRQAIENIWQMNTTLITSWTKEVMLAWREVPWKSTEALLSLAQSSLIDENADVLTAHESLINKL